MKTLGIARPLVLCSLLFCTASCGVLGYDHRARVAVAVLNQPAGRPNDAALSAALNARFAAGTSPEALRAFVQSLDGKCGHIASNQMHCEIPLTAVICVAQELELVVSVTPAGAIEQVAAHTLQNTC